MSKQFKKKKKFISKTGYHSTDGLQAGMTGFLITCDKNRSREAIKEAYQIIEQYIEQLYPEEAKLYEQILEDNVDQLKQQKPRFTKMLYNFDTKVNCLVFIRLNREVFPKLNVDEISNLVFRDVYQDFMQICRYCYKMIPIRLVCRATLEELKQQGQAIIDHYFTLDEPKSYQIVFKTRYTDKLSKQDTIKTIQSMIEPLHYQDWLAPDLTIFVEINGAILYMNVLKNYKQFNEYAVRKGGTAPNFNFEEKVGMQQRVYKKLKGDENQALEEGENQKEEQEIMLEDINHEEQEIDLL